jgi:hypothetical protein
MEFNKKIAVNTMKNRTDRSAWDKGVTQYALMLADNIPDDLTDMLKVTSAMLCGAHNWVQYSYGGLAYVCDGDIAAALCSPSELKRCKGGTRNPNRNENWMDVQARAIFQAAKRLFRAGLVEG